MPIYFSVYTGICVYVCVCVFNTCAPTPAGGSLMHSQWLSRTAWATEESFRDRLLICTFATAKKCLKWWENNVTDCALACLSRETAELVCCAAVRQSVINPVCGSLCMYECMLCVYNICIYIYICIITARIWCLWAGIWRSWRRRLLTLKMCLWPPRRSRCFTTWLGKYVHTCG